MKYIKLFEEFMIEKKKVYDYNCAMLYFDFPEIKKLHEQISVEDVYVDPEDNTFGLESEPHCTLLYGLHSDVKLEVVENIMKNFVFGNCTITNASLFENEKFDVLKYDVDGPGLHDCNAELSKLPHTTDYPNYHPHLTIAYIKSGLGKKYAEMLDNTKRELKPECVVYSQSNGTKTKINL